MPPRPELPSPNQPARPRLLVIRGGAIGDFILTLPVLAALRRQFRQSAVELLGYPTVTALAVAGGLADQAHSLAAPALASFFARHGELDPFFASLFSQFTTIISFLHDPEDIFRANVARCSSARFIRGPHRPADSSPVHATEVLLKPLAELGLANCSPVPSLRLAIPGEARLPAGSWLGLHAGSGSERKNWPESNWARLLERLVRQTRLNFLVVGGEAEGRRLERLCALLPTGRFRCLQDRPLTEVARRLAQCSVFLGHDSGLTHLAAALSVPGLILWGPSNPVVWRPRSDRMALLHEPAGLDQLSVKRVIAALVEHRLIALGNLRAEPRRRA